MNIIQFNEEAVMETRELAKLYCKTPSEITNAYFLNPDRFQEGEHYYLLDEEYEGFTEFKKKHLDEECINMEEVYLWTDEGLYEHALLLKGKHLWHAYCQFIYFVFNKSEEVKQAVQVLQRAEDILLKEKFLYLLAKELYAYESFGK